MEAILIKHSIYNYFIEGRIDIPKIFPFASWPGAMINPQWLDLSIYIKDKFHSPKNVRDIGVRLYYWLPVVGLSCEFEGKLCRSEGVLGLLELWQIALLSSLNVQLKVRLKDYSFLILFQMVGAWLTLSMVKTSPVRILYKCIAGRYRSVRAPDRFIKNASWVHSYFFF